MEPGALQQAQASEAGGQQQKLWDQAPGWRNLVIGASLLTTVALALPLMPEPAVKSAGLAAAPKPHPVQTAALTPAPAKPVVTPAAPAPAPVVTHAKALKTAAVTHQAPLSAQTTSPATPPAQLASAAPQTPPQSAAEPATAPQSNVCLLISGPVAPHLMGMGRVIAFEDRPTSLARIQLTQRQSGGLIDPAYVDNLRVHVDLGNGRIRVLLVPKGMTVNIGDLITWQNAYRNLNLPCNYIPNLISTDMGPPRKPPPSQPPSPQQ